LLNGTSALFRPLVPRIVEVEHTSHLEITRNQHATDDKSTSDKRRLKHEIELALTTVYGKKFQQDTQRLKKLFS